MRQTPGPLRALLWVLLLLLARAASGAPEEQCDGPVVQLVVRAAQPPRNSTTLFGVLAASFGGIPSFNLTPPAPLVAAQPLRACAPLAPAPGAVFLVERGNCSFTAKYSAVLAAGGAAMLLFDDVPGCITMGGSLNDTNSSSTSGGVAQRNASAPPAVSLTRADGVALLASLSAGAPLRLALQLLDVPALDASALLLWLMAVSTVVAGSLWAGADFALTLKGGCAGGGPEDGRRRAAAAAADGGGGAGGALDVLEVTSAGAVGFVLFSSAVLLLLFFFMNRVFFFILLLGFAAAGAQALTLALLPLVGAAAPRLAAATLSLPCGAGEVGGDEALAAPLALAAAAAWAVWRNAAWSWVLQDALGIAVMLLVLRTLRLPNLRVACVLLPLCFFYDVFWVFIQPMLTGGSESVMVEVASGAGSQEYLPMLLRVPRLSGPPIVRGAYSMLGFGDVILPGLLVALTRRLDLAAAALASRAPGGAGASRHCGYFVPCALGYAAGLLLTYVALLLSWFGDQGQPALLYLVPCTLGVVLLLAAWRGELAALLAAPPAQDDAQQAPAGGAGSPGAQARRRRSPGAEPDDQRVALLAGGSSAGGAARPLAEGVEDQPADHGSTSSASSGSSSPVAGARWGGRLSSGRSRRGAAAGAVALDACV